MNDSPMSSAITVLLADDEPDMRLLLCMVLERAGFQVVAESIDGDDALATVARLAPPPIPAVMVLDNQMPGVSGLDVAERVLADTPGQRIILFSAFLNADVRQRAHEIGIRACLPKADLNSLPAVIAALAAE